MEFMLLGPFEVVLDELVIGIGSARQKAVLASLLLEANHVVTIDRLIAAIWDDSPPRTAKTQVQITISALRRLLGDDAIVTRPPGYLMEVPQQAVDLAHFERLKAAGMAAAADHRLEEAVRHLRAALSLWRGDAPEGVAGSAIAAVATRLNEHRISLLQDCIDLELRIGGNHELIGELSELVAVHPLNERFRAQYMLSLYRAGRQVEALEAYRAGRRILQDEFGLDPGEELSRLEYAILTRDPQILRKQPP